jgi:hypothetical protein
MERYVRIILVVVGRDNGQLFPTKKSCPVLFTSKNYQDSTTVQFSLVGLLGGGPSILLQSTVQIATYLLQSTTVRAGRAAVCPCQATHIQYWASPENTFAVCTWLEYTRT